MFVDIIKAADMGYLATDNDQQSYACRPMVDILSILSELGSRA